MRDLSMLLNEDDFEPLTPQRSPVSSPFKRPMSNTPNAMMRKKVHFVSPIKSEASESTERVGGDIVEIGSIFEGDEGDTLDDSSFLSTSVVLDHGEPFYLNRGLAGRSYVVLPTTESSSGYDSDDVFSVASTKPTPPTTVEGSEDGSPAPEAIPQNAIRPAPVQEEISTVTQKTNKSYWASIKVGFSKRSGGCTTASTVEFTRVQRRTSSWTKVERKLQKLQPLPENKLEKKGRLRKGCKKALKAITRGFLVAITQSSVAPLQ